MTGVIYQIYPRSFQDTTDNGIGDLPGITRRLDYLAGTLGIDAIWISPFYPSPMADFGYDVSDYTDVHPLFGTLADFDELVDEALSAGVGSAADRDWMSSIAGANLPNCCRAMPRAYRARGTSLSCGCFSTNSFSAASASVYCFRLSRDQPSP